MKNRYVKISILFLSLLLISISFTGCSSNSKNKEAQQAQQEDSRKKGGKGTAKDKDEVAGKEDAEQASKENAGEESTESGGDTATNKDNGNSTTSTGNKKETAQKTPSGTTAAKGPTSTKKVSLNRDRLYNALLSIYKEPEWQESKKLSEREYEHQLKGSIPAEIQYIFDWYFAVLDDNGPEELLLKDERHEGQFYQTASNVLQFDIAYSLLKRSDGTVKMATNRQEAKQRVNQYYKQYSDVTDSNNKVIKDAWNDYDKKVKEANAACDAVVSAASKADIAGKDEVTAVNNIISYLCDNCEYWDAAVTAGNYKGQHITECLSEHHAVCDGYAKAFYAMCCYAGLDAHYYWGVTNKNENHAWDTVKINGTTYYFDVTWHDIIESKGGADTKYVWSDGASFGKEHIQKGADIQFW